ncbi:MAG: DUF3300 domain-containing protein [Pseudomonadales bacterium]|nr:DUF3300 domain-containing protein [Pseudomonadales bacterium]
MVFSVNLAILDLLVSGRLTMAFKRASDHSDNMELFTYGNSLRWIHYRLNMVRSGPAKRLLTQSMLHIMVVVLAIGTGFYSDNVYSEETATEAASDGYSATEINTLIAPIALYPDELISIVLPASSFPLQIVQAARFLEKQKTNENLEPDEDWDSSVLSLLNYPELIEIMNEDLDWTWKLGEAVVNQQQDVMASIQLFRTKVDKAGNLKSNEKTVVIKETQVIKIESASPEVIYVPSYNPTTVVVYSPAPYPWVYSAPYPYYYSPAATFWSGMFVGAAISYGVHWHDHHHGYGHGDIDINRNTNININSKNVNRNSVRQNNRSSVNSGRGSSNNWRSNRSSTQVGRPGKQPSSLSGKNFSTRPTNNVGTRIGDTRTGNRVNSSNRSTNRQGNIGSSNRSESRQSSIGSNNRQRNPTGSFGDYQRGANTARNSQRGMSSRSGMSTSSRGSSKGSGRARQR